MSSPSMLLRTIACSVLLSFAGCVTPISSPMWATVRFNAPLSARVNLHLPDWNTLTVTAITVEYGSMTLSQAATIEPTVGSGTPVSPVALPALPAPGDPWDATDLPASYASGDPVFWVLAIVTLDDGTTHKFYDEFWTPDFAAQVPHHH